MRTVWFIAQFSFLALLGISANAETISALFDRYSLQLKDQAYERDCGPISFFDAMILSPKNLKRTLLKLPGETLDDKYRSFMRLYGTKPSQLNPSEPRFKPDLGISLPDLTDMGNDLIGQQDSRFETKTISQQKSPFLETLADLNASITKGFAPVLAVTFLSSDPSKKTTGHAVMLMEIVEYNESQRRATLKILNPDGFDVTLMQVAEDSQGRLQASAANIWPRGLPVGLMLMDSYLILSN